MINRPKSWQDLHWRIRERLISFAKLDYCPYDESSDEVAADCLRGNGSDENNKIIQNVYAYMSDDVLEAVIIDVMTKMLLDCEEIRKTYSGKAQ